MKKKSFVMLLCVLLLVLGGALMVGCGSKKDGKTGNKKSNKEQTTSYSTLEEYLSTPEGKKTYTAFQESMGDEEGMTFAVKGNMLSISYVVEDVTLADYSDEDRAKIMQALEESMEGMLDGVGEPFKDAAETFENMSGVDGVIVEVVYVDTNHERLYAQEFTAD